MNTSLDFWGWLKEDPERVRAFNSSMTARHRGGDENAWHRKYPVHESLAFGLSNDSDEALLVDVGGGWGQDLLAFRSAHTSKFGRLVLQDQASALAEADKENLTSQSIEAMPHNFFEPQPIRGARAFFFHPIHHHWPDSECRTILRHTAAAMLPNGHSKLLILEDVLPDVGASTYLGLRDLHMMTLFGSMERTGGQWRKLLAEEGLKIVKIWTLAPGPNTERLIEAFLSD